MSKKEFCENLKNVAWSGTIHHNFLNNSHVITKTALVSILELKETYIKLKCRFTVGDILHVFSNGNTHRIVEISCTDNGDIFCNFQKLNMETSEVFGEIETVQYGELRNNLKIVKKIQRDLHHNKK